MSRARVLMVGLFCVALPFAGCSSDTKSDSTKSSVDPGSGSDGTIGQSAPNPASGDVDCASVETAFADLTISWQVVLGLQNSAPSEWSQIPLGHLAQFGDQIDTVRTAVSGSSEAVATLDFMDGANDIVQRGFAGEAAAQQDLATYLGTDVQKNIFRQVPLAEAYDASTCKS